NPQQVLELRSQAAQPQRRAACIHAVMNADQRAQPGAVDKRHFAHINDQLLLVFSEQALHLLAQAAGLLAEHDVALQRYNRNPINVSTRDLERHLRSLIRDTLPSEHSARCKKARPSPRRSHLEGREYITKDAGLSLFAVAPRRCAA